MAGVYNKLAEVANRLSLQIDVLPKPVDIHTVKDTLRPLYTKLSKLMGEDDDALFIHPVAQPAPAALSPPGSKRSRLEEEAAEPVSPLRPVMSPKLPPAPKKAGRRTRRQQRRMKPKH